ncbi:hypothetical protein ACVNPX_03005 [Staphylococcus aureus]
MQWKVTGSLNDVIFVIVTKLTQESGKGVAKALGIDINSIDLETENDET